MKIFCSFRVRGIAVKSWTLTEYAFHLILMFSNFAWALLFVSDFFRVSLIHESCCVLDSADNNQTQDERLLFLPLSQHHWKMNNRWNEPTHAFDSKMSAESHQSVSVLICALVNDSHWCPELHGDADGWKHFSSVTSLRGFAVIAMSTVHVQKSWASSKPANCWELDSVPVLLKSESCCENA